MPSLSAPAPFLSDWLTLVYCKAGSGHAASNVLLCQDLVAPLLLLKWHLSKDSSAHAFERFGLHMLHLDEAISWAH